MNSGMAHRARLVLLRQVVCRSDRSLGWKTVALQAQQTGLAYSQQARVRGPVRGVTTGAAFGLDGKVLENEWALLVRMALHAHGVTASDVPYLPQGAGAVKIVTVRAFHQALVHAVMERFRKIGLGSRVASVAQLGLTLRQQAMRFFGVVGRMAVQAADIVAGVSGPGKMRLPLAISVTTQAAGARLRARELLETNNLADITAAGDVIGSRSVTGLAAVTVFQCRLKVRSRLEVLRVKIFVARLAGIGTHILRSLHNGTCGDSAASCISGKTGQGGPEQDQHD